MRLQLDLSFLGKKDNHTRPSFVLDLIPWKRELSARRRER